MNLAEMVEELVELGYTQEDAEYEVYRYVNDNQERKSTPIDLYLNVMDISSKDKEERKKTTEDLFELMMFVFALIRAQNAFNTFDATNIRYQLISGYNEILGQLTDLNNETERHVDYFADNFMKNTSENLNDSWYLSEDRALFIAENESLDSHAYKDYNNAIKRGFKHKKWVAQLDKRTRKTHSEVNGTVIGINEYFHVGNADMFFPRDTFTSESTGYDYPEETVNCRCTVRYTR